MQCRFPTSVMVREPALFCARVGRRVGRKETAGTAGQTALM